MKDDAFDEVEEESVSQASEGTKLNHSMAAVVDRLFDNFKRYSFEFNRTQDNREYEISCERPASMRTNAEYLDMGRPIKYCLGHLASRNWSLIIQGEENAYSGLYHSSRVSGRLQAQSQRIPPTP